MRRPLSDRTCRRHIAEHKHQVQDPGCRWSHSRRGNPGDSCRRTRHTECIRCRRTRKRSSSRTDKNQRFRPLRKHCRNRRKVRRRNRLNSSADSHLRPHRKPRRPYRRRRPNSPANTRGRSRQVRRRRNRRRTPRSRRGMTRQPNRSSLHIEQGSLLSSSRRSRPGRRDRFRKRSRRSLGRGSGCTSFLPSSTGSPGCSSRKTPRTGYRRCLRRRRPVRRRNQPSMTGRLLRTRRFRSRNRALRAAVGRTARDVFSSLAGVVPANGSGRLTVGRATEGVLANLRLADQIAANRRGRAVCRAVALVFLLLANLIAAGLLRFDAWCERRHEEHNGEKSAKLLHVWPLCAYCVLPRCQRSVLPCERIVTLCEASHWLSL